MARGKQGKDSGNGDMEDDEGMAKRPALGIGDYRYPDKRKNNPPAKIAA